MSTRTEDFGRLPNALIAGVQRSGTTSLHYYLGGHPDIFMCTPKSPRFFSNHFFDGPGKGPGDERVACVSSLDDYSALFAASGDAAIVGEASAENLLLHRQVVPMMRSVLGDPAIILMLRQPAERAFSHYSLRILERRETLSFDEALEQEEVREQAGWGGDWRYAGGGFYAEGVEHFLSTFTRVYIGLFDDLAADTPREVKRILAFLGVDAEWRPASFNRANATGLERIPGVNAVFRRSESGLQGLVRGVGKAVLGERGWVYVRERVRNKALAKTSMDPDARRRLTDLYRPDIEKLQGIIGRDLSHWLR
jgi:hypothetical protein